MRQNTLPASINQANNKQPDFNQTNTAFFNMFSIQSSIHFILNSVSFFNFIVRITWLIDLLIEHIYCYNITAAAFGNLIN